jgi:hypothetical protein
MTLNNSNLHASFGVFFQTKENTISMETESTSDRVEHIDGGGAVTVDPIIWRATKLLSTSLTVNYNKWVWPIARHPIPRSVQNRTISMDEDQRKRRDILEFLNAFHELRGNMSVSFRADDRSIIAHFSFGSDQMPQN